MRLPKPIYETLPALYVAGGIAAIIVGNSFMSFTSGILLSCSGIFVLILRRNYRLEHRKANQAQTQTA